MLEMIGKKGWKNLWLMIWKPVRPNNPRWFVYGGARRTKLVAGVAGGLGRYLGIDPVLHPSGVCVVGSVGGIWCPPLHHWLDRNSRRTANRCVGFRPQPVQVSPVGTIIGATVIAVGSVLLMSEFLPDLSKYLWPIGLVSIGVFIMLGGRK